MYFSWKASWFIYAIHTHSYFRKVKSEVTQEEQTTLRAKSISTIKNVGANEE